MRLRLGYRSEAAEGTDRLLNMGPVDHPKEHFRFGGWLVVSSCIAVQILKRKWFTGACPGLTAEARLMKSYDFTLDRHDFSTWWEEGPDGREGKGPSLHPSILLFP